LTLSEEGKVDTQIIRFLLATTIALAIAVMMLFVPMPTPARARATGNTYLVNSTDDTSDADLGNPACADLNGHCTLRAAIMQANFVTGADTITLPSGVYLLTRLGDDDLAVLGDLDITDDLTIQGAGSGATVVDGNGAVTGDRVFQILSSAKETSFSGLTIQNGKKISNTFDECGGLYWDGGGGHLHLDNVTFYSNTARYGGGLFLNYSSSGDVIDMNHVIVHANIATTGAAGGLGVNFGDFAEFDMRDSQVFSNTAYEGGGIYLQGTPSFGLLSAHIENGEIYSNTASLSAGIENHSGDGIVPIVVLNSHLHDNAASFCGGAIGNYGTLVISATTLDANSASTRAGGLYDYEGGRTDIKQSTFSGNTAQFGGGIFSEHIINDSARLTLTNSTLSGNIASHDGGGLYLDGGQLQLFNVTVAANRIVVPNGDPYQGLGGGAYISATVRTHFVMKNSLLGGNTHRYGAMVPAPDDCVGLVYSTGYNFFQDPDNCPTTNNLGNISSQDPLLGPLQFNGGPTRTHALSPGSPAIDAGDPGGCTDSVGAALTIDQRGWHRPFGSNCDIGAYERGAFLFLPLIFK
jgi:CSLREA domain-containing protein